MRSRVLCPRGLALAGTVLLAASQVGGALGAAAPQPNVFSLTSPDPDLRHHFPDKYVLNGFGCTGGNVSPPLRWSNVPPGTLSYVITLFDQDEHATPSGWWHWVVYDIPATARQLPAGAGAGLSASLPAGARQGRSDLGTDAYHGPCPDKGDAPHRYVFTIYALNVAHVDVPPEPVDPSGAMVVASLAPNLLGQARLVIRQGR